MPDLTAHHTGIVVRDLEESLSFYRDTLGLDLVEEFTLAEAGIGKAIDVEGVSGAFAHLDAGGSRVELIEYDPEGSPTGAEAVNQIGAAHLGFEVPDVDAFYADLPADAEPLSEPQEIEIGIEILFFSDPDGNFVEVLEG